MSFDDFVFHALDVLIARTSPTAYGISRALEGPDTYAPIKAKVTNKTQLQLLTFQQELEGFGRGQVPDPENWDVSMIDYPTLIPKYFEAHPEERSQWLTETSSTLPVIPRTPILSTPVRHKQAPMRRFSMNRGSVVVSSLSHSRVAGAAARWLA